jgi:FkbM family methyltransferase
MAQKTFLNPLLKRTGKLLYQYAFPVYKPVYDAYKVFVDRHARRTIRENVKPGMVVVDIGANLGSYTHLFLRQIGPHGRVHAFEPTEKSSGYLEKKFSHDKRVTLNQLAVAGHTGEVAFYESPVQNAENRTWPAPGMRPTPSRMAKCVRLDDYFPAGARVDFIKIDIEGFEFDAFQGMKRVLTENWNIRVLTEYWPYGMRFAGREPKKFLKFFEELDFKIYLTGAKLTPITSETPLSEEKAEGYDVLILRG